MIFVAIYDFDASNGEEVSIKAGDLMTILEASDPDWSLVSIKSSFEAPSGLVPKSYIEPAQPKYSVVALYDYNGTNEDEVSVVEGEQFNVYLDDDQDWYWGTNSHNMDGLVPRNYFQEISVDVNPDADAHSQKNKLLNALDGFGFANAPTKKSTSEPKLELIMYLVVENDKKKKRRGYLGVGEDYMVSFLDEKSKKTLYQFNLSTVTFSEKKSKKFIVNISQTDGTVETKEYEGDKSDIQGLVAQFTQCQALFKKALGSPKLETIVPSLPEQVSQTTKVELKKQNSARKIVVALYDYTAADDQELSILENENLLVLDENDPDWWMVRSMKKGGKEGFVPRSYVQQKQKLGDIVENHQNVGLQEANQLDSQKREMENAREREVNRQREEAEALEREEAERIQTWKTLEEQRILWGRERQEKEDQNRRRLEIEELSRSREEKERLSSEVVKNEPVFSPSSSSRPEISAPPVALRPNIGPPPIASRPEIAPPPIASRPEIAPLPIASRPEIAPPPIASRPEIAPPPIASRPEFAPPPIASRPDIAPPPIASRPELAPPPIASRPDISPLTTRPVKDAPPPMGGRLSFAPPDATPSVPIRPSTQAIDSVHSSSLTSGTFPSRMFPYSNRIEPAFVIREWTDKSGSFKVNAVLISVENNKVHLRKGETGGKITIQLDKLHPNDIDYIRSIPGYGNVATTIPSAQKIPQQNRTVVDANILAQAAAIKISEPPSSSFVYNGFDWKIWLVNAGVSPGDAIAYGRKFCAEKLDSTSISSLDRELLRALGVSEGDIIRIKRAVVESISVNEEGYNSRELEAQTRNLEKIRKVSSSRSSYVDSDGKLDDRKKEQIESDEMFARKLQLEDIQPQIRPKAQKSFSSNAVDFNAIKDASVILEASNNTPKNIPSVLRKSVTVNKNPTAFSTLPSTDDAITKSLGITGNESSSKHNPWSITSQESKSHATNASIIPSPVQPIMPSRSVNLPPPVIPVGPNSVNSNLIPSAKDALNKTQMQQKEAQLALQRAQYDLALAQEQAKQAAMIQEQTKRAQAQEAESAMALAKAQEAARQAAMIKEQSERALRAAQAGIIQSTTPQNPVGSFGGSFGQPTSSMNSYTNMLTNSYGVPNRPYQLPGAAAGMMMRPDGKFAAMAPNVLPQGGFPRPGLQAPLIPVGNSTNNAGRPNTGLNPLNSGNPVSTTNDPYAVFRNVDVNEPSIFAGQISGIQNQSSQHYSQSILPQSQSQTFFSQSNTSNYLPGPYINSQDSMQGQYGNIPSQGSFQAQYSNIQSMNPQNQFPGPYSNNRPQYNTETFQNAGGRPNFMPPYNPGSQGYNR